MPQRLDAPEREPGVNKKKPARKYDLEDMSVEEFQAEWDKTMATLETQDIGSLAPEGEARGKFEELTSIVTSYRQLLGDESSLIYTGELAERIRSRLAALNMQLGGPLSAQKLLILIDGKIKQLSGRLGAVQDFDLENREAKIEGTKNAITSLKNLISEELLSPEGGLR